MVEDAAEGEDVMPEQTTEVRCGTCVHFRRCPGCDWVGCADCTQPQNPLRPTFERKRIHGDCKWVGLMYHVLPNSAKVELMSVDDDEGQDCSCWAPRSDEDGSAVGQRPSETREAVEEATNG